MTKRNNGVAARVYCKQCDKWFEQREWLNNTNCDTPEVCSCPKVQKAMMQARNVISHFTKPAETATKKWNLSVTTSTIPTQRNEAQDQLEMKVEPIVTINMERNCKRGK